MPDVAMLPPTGVSRLPRRSASHTAAASVRSHTPTFPTEPPMARRCGPSAAKETSKRAPSCASLAASSRGLPSTTDQTLTVLSVEQVAKTLGSRGLTARLVAALSCADSVHARPPARTSKHTTWPSSELTKMRASSAHTALSASASRWKLRCALGARTSTTAAVRSNEPDSRTDASLGCQDTACTLSEWCERICTQGSAGALRSQIRTVWSAEALAKALACRRFHARPITASVWPLEGSGCGGCGAFFFFLPVCPGGGTGFLKASPRTAIGA
mmetsp:Transcript_22720/g.66968  ORF Transcript_22720/g.66968 Transcript_22720/m.66968 type:complete len:272 (+) Transcript_22720:278-1093(+)